MGLNYFLRNTIIVLIVYFSTCTTFVRLQNIHDSSSFDRTLDEISTTPISDYEDVNSKPKKSEILTSIIDGSDYDPKIRPPSPNGSGPTQVHVGVYLRSVENIDDVRMQYSVQMTFWQDWIDPRLKYSHIQDNIQYLQLVHAKRIWMPVRTVHTTKYNIPFIMLITNAC